MNPTTKPTRYRPNVAAIIVNEEKHILACERSDVSGGWQLPQGGIEAGERPIDTFFREIHEEIGTTDVTLLGQLPTPICYDWPEHLYSRGFCGQEQWYFLALMNPKAQITLDHHGEVEFISYAWLTSTEFFNRASGFKAEAYKNAIDLFIKQFPNAII